MANEIMWGKLNDFEAYLYKLNKKVNKNKIITMKTLKFMINFFK